MSVNTIVTKTNKAKALIEKAIETHKEKVAVACSFGKDSIVVVHLAMQVKKEVPVFSILTKFKPKETFEYKDKMQKLWNINLKVYQSKANVDPNLYKTDPYECCQVLKVEPTKEAVKNLDAWICGLRDTEGRTRKNYQEVEKKAHLIKYNPILKWTELDIWRYIAIHQIPVHPWYALGHRSLGCGPCTELIDDEELERAGRWLGTSKCGGECGIHTKTLK